MGHKEGAACHFRILSETAHDLPETAQDLDLQSGIPAALCRPGEKTGDLPEWNPPPTIAITDLAPRAGIGLSRNQNDE